jgi:licheninase
VIGAVVVFVLACAAVLVVRQGPQVAQAIAHARRSGGPDLAPQPTATDSDPSAPAAGSSPSYLSLSPTPAPSGSRSGTAVPAPRGWTLVDSDDFTAPLSRKRWGIYDSVSSNRVSRWSPDLVAVNKGVLTITGTGRDTTGRANRAGGLCWCFGAGNQMYGRWEVRTRIDPGAGYGGAILLWPKSDKWPDDGEVDFGETPHANRDAISSTVHWWTTEDNNNTDSTAVYGDFTQWHTFAVEWERGSVVMSVDGITYYDSRTGAKKAQAPKVPMHLALQLEPGPYGRNWIGSPDSNTPNRVRMQIDWVRLYRRAV